MPTEWAAENALSIITGCRIISPNVSRREYLFRKNRLARHLDRFTSRLSDQMHAGLGRNLFIFAMTLRKELLPLLADGSRKKWIYLFDTWEPNWNAIEQSLKMAEGLNVVYMSSSQAAEYFQKRLSCPVKWLPQAANSSEFDQYACNWQQKKNVILNIGRTNSVLNEFFERFSKKHGFRYVREESPGKVCFKNRNEFLKTLYESKIVVVHPRNLEYPKITGCVSMLTVRYFEAYQSGGIVCGFKPESGEFEKVLNGYPFISWSTSDEFEEALLSSLRDIQPWMEASLRIHDEHIWEVRLADVVKDLRANE